MKYFYSSYQIISFETTWRKHLFSCTVEIFPVMLTLFFRKVYGGAPQNLRDARNPWFQREFYVEFSYFLLYYAVKIKNHDVENVEE